MTNLRKNLIFILIIIISLLAIIIFRPKNFLFLSIFLSLLSCLPFYFKYEQRKPKTREFIIVVIMISLSIVSRIMFSFLPAIKPVFALIIITGASFGKETGFMTGSLTALISNMFFGQGPWTMYQMLLWGLIGYGAGFFNKYKLMENFIFRYFYAIISAIFFSVFIDLLALIATGFSLETYLTLLASSMLFVIYYIIANIIFMAILYKPITKKLERVKLKYGINIDKNYINY